MLRICFLVAVVMSAAMAFPQDEVLPETSPTLSQLSVHHPELNHASPKDAAHAKIKMMQAQGFDNTQCNQMATDAISGMTSTLKAEQDAMDALSTGADCLVTTPATRRLLGIATAQGHLDAAAVALVAAQADLAAKEATLQANKVAPITLTINLDTIGTNFAAIGAAVAADPAVVTAKAAVATAQTVKVAAQTVLVAEQATYDTSLVAAQDSSTECLCNAKAAHVLAWPSAQKVVTDNTQAWKEAHHVKCAVDGNADDACAVPAFTVTDKPLVAEAANVVCTSAPTPAPTAAPSEAPTPAPTAAPTAAPTPAPTSAPTIPTPTYLGSDIRFDTCTTGWSSCRVDSDFKYNQAGKIQIRNTDYAHGITQHAAGHINFSLNQAYTSLHVCMGISKFSGDSTCGMPARGNRDGGTGRFTINANGQTLMQPLLKRGGQDATCVDINITGKSTLNLVTDLAGTRDCDLTTWADMYVI